MCLIAFAWRAHPRWPLVLIANRDELHARPSAPAGFLADASDVFGGIDLRAGGSWLLASGRRRLAAITNVRVGLSPEAAPRSRGELVKEFAISDTSAQAFVTDMAPHAQDYGRFNLLLWDGQSLQCVGNHPQFHAEQVAPGLHALSNAALDTDWPKARRAKQALSLWLSQWTDAADVRVDVEPLFAALADTTPAADDELPDTGVGLDIERRLSPPFVVGDTYGTRCSTIVLAGCEGIEMTERRFGANQVREGEGRILACDP
ncbi:MAG TPA: NRDE family protein [Xanthomonadaceae bacterium]|jgi:uncharacterized protein with NRDE domain|nr:NRDE family protein [Xanthomonadaceae bacterium]